MLDDFLKENRFPSLSVMSRRRASAFILDIITRIFGVSVRPARQKNFRGMANIRRRDLVNDLNREELRFTEPKGIQAIDSFAYGDIIPYNEIETEYKF